MATLSISWTVPDAQAQRIKDEFCAYHGWTSQSSETQNQFIKRKIGEFIKDSIRAYRATLESDTARDTAIQEVNTNVTLT